MSFTTRLYEALTLIPHDTITNVARRVHRTVTKRHKWREALLNALVLAGFNFFSTLASISVTQIITEPEKALIAAAIAAGLGFFGRLMIERGISTGENQK